MRARVVIVAVALMAVPGGARAAGPVDDVARLYAEAYYDEALALVDRAEADSSIGRDEMTALRRFKLLCQVALGRDADALATAGAVVREAPVPAAGESDLPPPVRAMLREVRTRVVPAVARERYQHGREQFAAGAFAAALEHFDAAILLIDQEDLGLVSQPELADLRVLASGFRDLARSRAADAARPPRIAAPPAALPAGAAPVAAVPPAPAAGSVGAPEAIRQDIPARPPGVPIGNRAGVLEITITAEGSVADARMVTPIHPLYDALLLRAAGNWRYRPATVGGVPTAITKVLTINLALER